MDKKREHYMTLRFDEDQHEHPTCGCVLKHTEAGVRLYQCPTHDTAPDLLAALRRMVEHATGRTCDESCQCKGDARAAIAKAMAKSKPAASIPKYPGATARRR